jgi:hypothetical protein
MAVRRGNVKIFSLPRRVLKTFLLPRNVARPFEFFVFGDLPPENRCGAQL